MALVVKDRVKEVTTTTGTSNLTLGGAVYGFQSFSVIGNGNTTYYGIYDSATGDWEVGVGTYSTTGPTLTRDTVLESSNSGSKVVFGAGSKDVFVTYPAERSVYLDAAGSAVTVLDVGTLGVSTANISTANITAGTISTTPTSSNDLVNKTYVDGIAAQGISYHTPVKYEVPDTTGNLNATYNNGASGVGATLTNAGTQTAFTPDGVVAQVGDRILVYNQTNAAQNGVYQVTTVGSGSTNWVLTRTSDANTYGVKDPNALGAGDAFYVTSGNTGAGETYVCNTAGTITFGTTAITFAQISSAQVYSAGAGLTLSNLQFSITPVGTASTYGSSSSVPVFTTNAYGQVTSVTNTGIAISAGAVSGLAPSATTDTTNASNITSGTLGSARLTGSYTGITGVGTLTAGTWNASTIGAAYGGTGITSYTVGDILYADGATSLAKLADVATGNALLSGGVGTAPAWGKIGLQTHVSGTLQLVNGGTGATTASGARSNLGLVIGTDIPSVTGSGASGTWNINITGNAATATTSTTSTTATQVSNSVTFNNSGAGAASGNGFNGSGALTVSYNTVGAPSTTGANASGTWGISISGNAATATSATSATTATTATNWGSYGAVPAAGTSFGNANTIGRSDANGYTYFNYINSNTSNSENPSVSQVIVTNGGDNFYRKASIAHLTSSLSGTAPINISGNAATATTADQIDSWPFRNTGSNTGVNADTLDSNGITYYTAGVPNFTGNATDGALYSQAYSSSWQHQIAADYRSGQIALRGKNSGTWQSWRTVLDSGNYNSYAPTLTGGGASGTWGINITGSAGSASSVAWGNVTGKPSNIMFYEGFTLDANTMTTNSTGFTYSVNAPYTGPIARFSTGGSYDLWLNAPYSGGGANIAFRTRNGDTASLNSWQYPVVYDVNGATGALYGTIFYDSNNTGYYLDPASTSELNKVYYNSNMVSRNYGIGQVGLYSSYRYQAVFSMGEAYLLPADGTTTGNLYGIAWSHPNAGGAASNLASHGMLILENGGFYGAWGGGRLVTVADIRGTIFYDYNNTGYYCDPSSVSYLYGLTLAGGSYFRPNNWIQFDSTYGLYWPNNFGAHFHANDLSTYTQLALRGSKNSYGGFYDQFSAVNGFMYDSAGNGGVYREANGRWYLYYHLSNDCLGVGTSSTSSTYSLYLNKGVYAPSRIDATIYYDANDTTYYLDPNGTSYINGNGSTAGSSSVGLNIFSTGGNGAIMAFHRGGYYAVNMGLDSDNVIRIGGWSASANRLQMDMSGNLTMAGNVTAYSDEKLKKDWADLSDDFIERLASVKAGTYTRIDSGERQAGSSAQDWQELLPEVVSEDAAGTLALAYGNAAVVACVELAKSVVALRAEIKALRAH